MKVNREWVFWIRSVIYRNYFSRSGRQVNKPVFAIRSLHYPQNKVVCLFHNLVFAANARPIYRSGRRVVYRLILGYTVVVCVWTYQAAKKIKVKAMVTARSFKVDVRVILEIFFAANAPPWCSARLVVMDPM